MIITPRQREAIYSLTRFYSSLSESKYRSWSGADKTDAERHRLEAICCRKLARGVCLNVAIEELRKDWAEFCHEMNRKIAEAPKIRYGPSSGLSSIHYKHADLGAIDSSIIHISTTYRRIKGLIKE